MLICNESHRYKIFLTFNFAPGREMLILRGTCSALIDWTLLQTYSQHTHLPSPSMSWYMGNMARCFFKNGSEMIYMAALGGLFMPSSLQELHYKLSRALVSYIRPVPYLAGLGCRFQQHCICSCVHIRNPSTHAYMGQTVDRRDQRCDNGIRYSSCLVIGYFMMRLT